MRILMAGAAAIALAASGGAYAQGKGNGHGNDKGGGKNSAAQKHDNRGSHKADRGASRMAQSDRGGNKGNAKVKANAKVKVDRGPDRPKRAASVDNRKNGNDRRVIERESRNDRRDVRVRYTDRDRRDDDRRYVRGDRDTRWLVQDRNRGLIAGCPPGLAKKNNGCNPPGQVKDRYHRSVYGYNYRPSIFGLTNYDRRDDYYYRDGYLVRYGDRGGISSWLPLLGGALGIGNVWPSNYQSYRVPDYYVDYYSLGSPDRYRYADNVIYRVNPEDAAITSIAALITGDNFTIGQSMPMGYDVYNVPYAYRDRYYDTPQQMYRYSDGYVYQIDPETRLVAAAIDLLI